MPAYSPELQPAERLWPLTNEIVANQSPHNLDELEELIIYLCQQLLEQHDIRARVDLLPLVADDQGCLIISLHPNLILLVVVTGV